MTHPPPWATSFQGILESNKVSPQPLFLQGKQSQLPQSLLIRLVLQNLHQLCCPSLDILQYLKDLRLWWLRKQKTRGTSVWFVVFFFSLLYPNVFQGYLDTKFQQNIFWGLLYTIHYPFLHKQVFCGLMPNFSYLRENIFCHSQKTNSSSPLFIHIVGHRDTHCLQMGHFGWRGRSSRPHLISSAGHCFNEWTLSWQLWLLWGFPKALPAWAQAAFD